MGEQIHIKRKVPGRVTSDEENGFPTAAAAAKPTCSHSNVSKHARSSHVVEAPDIRHSVGTDR